jgi:aminopeptidase N
MLMTRPFSVAAVVAALLLTTVTGANAQPTGSNANFDPATGRAAHHYPPSRHVDYTHMKLAVHIADMNLPLMQCEQTLSFVVTDKSLTSLTLDARLLSVMSVTSVGHALTYKADGQELVVTFDKPIARGETVDLVTNYTVSRPPEGLFWTHASDEAPGRAAQLHTQGEAESASYWFPCRDFPNERMTTEVVATVPAGFLASSNGFLVSRTPSEDGLRETFHWLQDKSHGAHLVTLVVGKFDVVDVGTEALPMPVYVPVGRGGDVEASYGQTPRMIEYFEDVLDEPYPWDRYAQLLVWNFNYGGMENTSATTMHETAVLSPDALLDYDLEGLIAHELAHQWFGDLVTCRSWEHIWLNEGFATYFSALWIGHRDGEEGYEAVIRGNFDGLIARDRGVAPHAPGMVSDVYDSPMQPFFKAANPYSKGSSILHMLRQRVGDDVFFEIIATYVDRFGLALAETSDLRKVAEEVSGESLVRFFEQWCDRPGLPRVEVTMEWDAAASELVLSMKQTQTIDGYNPAYVFNAPIWIEEASGRSGWAALFVDARKATTRIPLDDKPAFVSIDPDMTVLAEWMVEQGADQWASQLERGPTLWAKVQAARALATTRTPAASSLLVRTVEDESLHVSLRVEALSTLAERGEEGRLMALGGVTIASPAVRKALVESIGRVAEPSDSFRDFVSFTLDRAARTDRAQSVRAAAVRAIGRAGLRRRLGVVTASLGVESQHDAIRRAAIASAATLEADLSEILPFVSGRYLRGTRLAAVSAIVRLSPQDSEAAFDAMVMLLAEKERRVHGAAGRAIVTLANPRGIDILKAYITSTHDETDRDQAIAWLMQLEEKLSEGQ